MTVQIIAEIGVNHDGSLSKAKKLVQSAIECGADAVKFQYFNAERLSSPETPKAPYQRRNTVDDESHLEMLKKLELTIEELTQLFKLCSESKIKFIVTPYSREDAQELAGMGVEFFKVASADIVDLSLHEFLSSTNFPVIISTGMCVTEEIDDTLAVYKAAGTYENIVLMQCTSAYPTAPENVNLNVLKIYLEKYGLPIGFSDHTSTPYAAFASVGMGVTWLEKHFTLNKNDSGPDHAASAEPAELRELISGIRLIERSMGSTQKKQLPCETAMAYVSRKSIVAKRKIHPGTLVTLEDLAFRRPGSGISPMKYKELIGLESTGSFSAGEQLSFDRLRGK